MLKMAPSPWTGEGDVIEKYRQMEGGRKSKIKKPPMKIITGGFLNDRVKESTTYLASGAASVVAFL
jgi:hypothetical protein